MKVVSWNINSINARIERFQQYLEREQPEVLCLQELKCEEAKFPAKLVGELGYQALVSGQKTYNGTAILTKGEAELVQKGFGDPSFDSEARMLHARYRGIDVICVYVPNGQDVGAERYVYKLRWYQRLQEYVAPLVAANRQVVLCGDFNVARHPDDVYDPIGLDGSLLYSAPERDALESLIAAGFVDSFRQHQPTGKHYSWWDYRALSFQMGKGMRIDYVFLTKQLAEASKSAWIDRNERKGLKPSDHAPVGVEL